MIRYLILITITFIFVSLSSLAQKEPVVLIQTEMGDIKIKLYNETPVHRDNFLKMAKEGTINGAMFHRVIKQFMIQGGDPESIGADSLAQLGNGGPGYTLPAEISDKFFHKKGALSAARQADQVNPEKRSSGSQFYVVHGRTFSVEELKGMEARMNQVRFQNLYQAFFLRPENGAYKERMAQLQMDKNNEGMKEMFMEIKPILDAEIEADGNFSFTEDQIKTYSEIGGAPHLDGAYSVFGEVIEGIDVVDKIAESAVGAHDRPKKDITMSLKVLSE